MQTVEFEITPLPPYRLDLTAWALKRRIGNTWDRWDADTRTYRRLVIVEGRALDVAATQYGSTETPILRIVVACSSHSANLSAQAIENAVRPIVFRLLGTELDLTRFYDLAETDAALGPLAERLRGLRPPRYQSLFEALTNAITCQQITLTAGIRILARLADRCGVSLGDARSFPQSEQVACLSDEELRGIGYSRQKARAMIELSALAQQECLDGQHVSNLPDEEAVARLRELYGVGRWTAEYALLRGDGRLQIFPGDDVGVRRRLEQWLGLQNKLDYGGVQQALEKWDPYGGLVYLHLLTDSLVESGQVDRQFTEKSR